MSDAVSTLLRAITGKRWHRVDPEKAKAEFLAKLGAKRKRAPNRPALKGSETQLVKAIRQALSLERDLVLYRNNTGVLRDKTGRPVRYGLEVGSADLVGILRCQIRDSRPNVVGRFIALEAKRDMSSEESEAQLAWTARVREMGGFCCTVRSVEEARAAIKRARAGERR